MTITHLNVYIEQQTENKPTENKPMEGNMEKGKTVKILIRNRLDSPVQDYFKFALDIWKKAGILQDISSVDVESGDVVDILKRRPDIDAVQFTTKWGFQPDDLYSRHQLGESFLKRVWKRQLDDTLGASDFPIEWGVSMLDQKLPNAFWNVVEGHVPTKKQHDKYIASQSKEHLVYVGLEKTESKIIPLVEQLKTDGKINSWKITKWHFFTEKSWEKTYREYEELYNTMDWTVCFSEFLQFPIMQPVNRVAGLGNGVRHYFHLLMNELIKDKKQATVVEFDAICHRSRLIINSGVFPENMLQKE